MAQAIRLQVVLLALVALLPAAHAEEPAAPQAASRGGRPTWSVGGGLVGSTLDPDTGGEIDSGGAFFVGQVMLDNGVVFQLATSGTEDDESGPVEDEFGRAGLTAGFVFRRTATVRPFVHGGLALLRVQESVAGLEVIDDGSQALTFGAGLMAGSGHHNFFLDLVSDLGHEVDDFFGVAIRSEFDLSEAHIGYVYRF